jgi:hypothetical protein
MSNKIPEDGLGTSFPKKGTAINNLPIGARASATATLAGVRIPRIIKTN